MKSRSHARVAFTVAVVAVVSMGIFACAPRSVGIWRDPDFTAQRLSEARIALGGIGYTGLGSLDAAILRSALDSLTWLQLSREAPRLDWAPPDYSREKLGRQRQSELVTKFELLGRLEPSDLTVLAEIAKGLPAYFIFGRVVENRVQSRDATDASGTRTEYSRRMAFSFAVYEAATGRLMWNGGLTLKREHIVSGTVANPVNDLGDVVGSILVELLSPSPPDIPSSSEMTQEILRNFAQELIKNK